MLTTEEKNVLKKLVKSLKEEAKDRRCFYELIV